jgi:hypothetical protein
MVLSNYITGWNVQNLTIMVVSTILEVLRGLSQEISVATSTTILRIRRNLSPKISCAIALHLNFIGWPIKCVVAFWPDFVSPF